MLTGSQHYICKCMFLTGNPIPRISKESNKNQPDLISSTKYSEQTDLEARD